MKPIRRLLAHALALAVPLCTWAQTEIDPNNSTSQATAVAYNTAMAGSTGNCAPADNSIDYFSFTPPQQGVLRIQTAMSNSGATDVNVSVQLRNNSGTLLTTFTATAGANNAVTNETFTHFCGGTGVYYISIPNPGTTVCTNYSFTYDVIAPVYANDPEPNQSTSQATIANANTNYDGHVAFGYDNAYDVYRAQAPNDGVISVTLLAENAGASAGTMTLYLQNSSGTILETWTANVGASGSPATNTFTRNCTGTEAVYYIQPANPTVCGVSYRLSYTVAAPLYADDTEPNQSTSQADPIAANTAYDGRVSFDYDNSYDVYVTQAPTDGVLSVTLLAENAGTSPGTMTLYLQNSSGTILETWTANVGTNGSPATNTFTRTCTGTEAVYYIQPYSPAVCGVSYRLSYTVTAPLYTDDAEPNQSTSQADPIVADTPYDGRVSFDYDNSYDVYVTQAPTDGVLSVTLLAENAGASTGTMTLYLQNSSGTILETWTANVGASGSPATNTFTRNCTGTEAVYFIQPANPTVCGVSYRLSYTVAAPLYADDAEPNQSTSQATIIDLNVAPAFGRVDFDYDNNFDYFRVNHAGGPLRVITSAENAGAAGVMSVYIRNSSGTQIVLNNTVAVGGNGIAVLDTTETAGSVAAGIYYIEPYSPSVCGVSYRLNCTDDDNDGVCNSGDLCANTPTGEGVNSNGCSCSQVVIDDNDVCTLDACLNGNVTNTFQDADSDLTCDANDGCPNDPNKIVPGQCGCGVADTDSDSDGTANCNDGCPNDPLKVAPGICGCGVSDVDTDSDGTADCNDLCPNDPNKVAPGTCGCGVSDVDTDGDLTADCNDGCPNDPLKVAPGICGCGVSDADTDGDLTVDCNDGCPNDPLKTAPGICGCGVADTDSDNDGTADCNDGCPNDANKTSAGNCGCGNPEPGALCNDGNVLTINDVIRLNCLCAGTPVSCTVNGDCNDNNPCTSDACDNNVCVFTPLPDGDSDGTCDAQDGCPADPNKIAPGICGCGVADTDSDSDGTANCNDACPNDPNKIAPGICGCGVSDADSDSDGTANCNDGCPNDPLKIAPGTCGCGNPEPGATCNDGNANTTGDVIGNNCICAGTPIGGGCQPTQLTTTADPVITCNIVNVKLDGTTTLWAYEVPGANKYQYLFTNTPGQPAYSRSIAGPTRSRQLFQWYTTPLKAGRTYRVQVRASFDNGATWCAYGGICTIKISNHPSAQFREPGDEDELSSDTSGMQEAIFQLFPNPVRDGLVTVQLTGLSIDEESSATIEVFDAMGRLAHSEQAMAANGELNHVMNLDKSIVTGMYQVVLSVNGERFHQRLMVD